MGKKHLILFLLFCFTFCQGSSLHLRRQSTQPVHELTYRTSSGLGGSVAGFIFGPILFILSFIMIWNNEKKAAIDNKRISLANQIVQNVNPWKMQEMKTNDGKLVHVSGQTKCDQVVTDYQTGISIKGAIKIVRKVQVREYRSVGSNRNQRIQLQWVSSNLQNAGDGHYNDPTAWFLKTQETKAKNVWIGNYLLSQSLKDKLECKQVFNPTIQDAYTIGTKYKSRVKNQPIVNGQYMYFPASNGSVENPGTMRVKYTICRPGDTSIISQSQRNSFVPFRIDIYQNGKPDQKIEVGDKTCCCCLLCDCTAQLFEPLSEIDLISQKQESFQQMIDNEKRDISLKRNVIRFFLYLLMVVSICCFFSPITTLIGYVPFLGGILSNALGFAIFLAACIVCIPLFILAVSVSWLIFHPKIGLIILGIGILIAGIVLTIIFINKGKNNDQAQVQQAVKHLGLSLRFFKGIAI